MASDRVGYSLSGLARHLGIDRRRVRQAIRCGELRAARLGERDFLILEHDVRAWLAQHRVQPTAHAEARVAEILEHEAAGNTT